MMTENSETLLTPEMFSGVQGCSLRVMGGGGQSTDLVLENVVELPRFARPGKRMPFRLMFRGGIDVLLGQACYLIEHPDMGSLGPLLFVPVMPPDGEAAAHPNERWYAVEFA